MLSASKRDIPVYRALLPLVKRGASDAGMMTRTRQRKGRDHLFKSCLRNH